MKTRIYLTIAAAFGLVVLAACRKEETPAEPSGSFGFVTSTEGFAEGEEDVVAKGVNPAVRLGEVDGKTLWLACRKERMTERHAETKTAVTTEVTGTFRAFGYRYEGAWNPATCCPTLFYDENPAAYTGTRQKMEGYFWPGNEYKVRFYGVWPVSDAYSIVSASTDPGAPVIGYAASAADGSNMDILEAQSTEYAGDAETDVQMTFRHTMSGVRIKTGLIGYTGAVKDIVISGVAGYGEHRIGEDGWMNHSTPTAYTFPINRTISGNAGEDLVTGANTMLVIPQTLSDTARITITFHDIEFTADISGQTWEQGVINNYYFAFEDNQLERIIDTRDGVDTVYLSSIAATTASVTVYSKKIHVSGLENNVEWGTEFSIDGGASWTAAVPSWMSLSAYSGNGNANAVTVNWPARSISYPAERKLKDNAPEGTEDNPVDLSRRDAFGNGLPDVNTANCYVVGAPGWYMLPLVYGNAVKGGTTNEGSYKRAAATNALANFLNAYDAGIKSPDIVSDIAASGKAINMDAGGCLLWTTCDGGITVSPALKTVGSYTYLCFNIPETVTNNFNAVIGVKATDGNIVWSWHIWATGEKLAKYQIGTYSFLNRSLGSVGGTVRTYTCRSARIKFYQKEARENFWIVDVIDKPLETAYYKGQAVYYQWGRKDPFYPVSGTNSTAKVTQYGSYKNTNGSAQISLGNGIRVPYQYVYNTSGWSSNTSLNLWDMDNSSNGADSPVIKTVYDPCPFGFSVPRMKAFESWNGKYVGAFDTGYWFKRNTSDGIGVFAGTYGRLSDASGNIKEQGYGYYWSSAPSSSSNGYCVYFNSGSFYPANNCYRCYGMCVRPQSE